MRDLGKLLVAAMVSASLSGCFSDGSDGSDATTSSSSAVFMANNYIDIAKASLGFIDSMENGLAFLINRDSALV